MTEATVVEKFNELLEKHKKLEGEGILDKEKNKVLEEKNKVLEEKNKVVGEKNKVLEEKNKRLEKNKVLLEKNHVEKKHNQLVATLRAKVECPVCIAIPTDGPMASCPRGHLVCLSCQRTMVAQGLVNCPNCREPMGNNMSLLAKTVIENIEQECKNEGCNKMWYQEDMLMHKAFCNFRKVLCSEISCKQMVPHKDLVKHKEELCEYRRVLCPGNSSLCKVTLPFCALSDHFKVCTSVVVGYQGTSSVVFKKDISDKDTANMKTRIFKLNNEVFAVQTKMKNNKFSFGVLMLANREKCDQFKVTIEIQDDISETAFSAQFNPDPVDMKNSDEASLVVHKKKFAKMVTSGEDRIKYKINMKVSEKRAYSFMLAKNA